MQPWGREISLPDSGTPFFRSAMRFQACSFIFSRSGGANPDLTPQLLPTPNAAMGTGNIPSRLWYPLLQICNALPGLFVYFFEIRRCQSRPNASATPHSQCSHGDGKYPFPTLVPPSSDLQCASRPVRLFFRDQEVPIQT